MNARLRDGITEVMRKLGWVIGLVVVTACSGSPAPTTAIPTTETKPKLEQPHEGSGSAAPAAGSGDLADGDDGDDAIARRKHRGGTGSGRRAQVTIGAIGASGSLDQAIIKRYVRRSWSKMQSCYEKELLSDPKLAGTVTVTFTIDPSGAVSAAKASGTKPAVDTCIADVVKQILFPKPKDASSVQVTYPITLQP